MLPRITKHDGSGGTSALAVACALALTAAAIGGGHGSLEAVHRLEPRAPLSEVQTARIMAAAVAAARDLLGIDLPALAMPVVSGSVIPRLGVAHAGAYTDDSLVAPNRERLTPDLIDLPPPTF